MQCGSCPDACAAGSAEDRLDQGDELAGAERFRDVVIGPELEASETVSLTRAELFRVNYSA